MGTPQPAVPVMINENNIIEVFIRHYENYLNEVSEYLQVESALSLKVR